MKSITEFINENKEVTFIYKNDPRLETVWNVGDKVMVIKYDNHYTCRVWEMTTIKKVNKSSIVIDTTNSTINKFDKNGILKKNTKNTYLGKYTEYWVLYNKDLIEKSKDIKDLTDKGSCMWGYHFRTDDEQNYFKKSLKEFN